MDDLSFRAGIQKNDIGSKCMKAVRGASIISGKPDFLKYIFTASTILFLLLLVIVAGNVSAKSYWDAVFELGFEPANQLIHHKLACDRIERIFRLSKRISDHLVIDERLPIHPKEIQSRMASLDVGNLHELLPYSDPDSGWRGVGLRGRSHFANYNLLIVDPQIKDGLKSAQQKNAKKSDKQEHFGDIDLRTFIRPDPKNIFRSVTNGQFYLADLPAANVTRVINAMLVTLWTQSCGQVNPPANLLNKAFLDKRSKNVLSGFAGDFPNLIKLIYQYIAVESVVSPRSVSTDEVVMVDFRFRFKADAFAKDYPELGKFFKKVRGTVYVHVQIFNDAGQQVGIMEIDSAKNLLVVQFLTKNGRFLALHDDFALDETGGFGLTDIGSSQFNIKANIHLNIVGMRLSIEGLEFDLDYSYGPHGSNIRINLSQPLKAFAAGGLAFGFLPVWFIDILIPSNVEELTTQFFNTLANSNQGQGAKLEFGSFQQESLKKNLCLYAETEVLANGIIKLGLNLQSQLHIDQKKIVTEISKFRKKIWTALYQDYQLAALQKGCQ